MTIIHHHQWKEFFANKEINAMYLAVALNGFAEKLITIYVPIYFWELGYSFSKIIFFFVMVALWFVIVSVIGVKFISKRGVKHAMLYSTPFLILYYLGLNYLPQASWIFYILPILLAFRTTFFNFGWHLNFIEHSDSDKRSRQLAFLSSVGVITSFLYPFIGGVLIFWFGWHWIFFIASGLLILAIWPLLKTADVKERVTFNWRNIIHWIVKKENRGMNLSYFGYAIESIIGRILWPLFIFFIIGSVERVGAVVSLSMIASLGVLYFIGRLSDKLSKRVIIKKATFMYALAWVVRIFAQSAGFIFIADTYKNITTHILHIPWSSLSYDLAEQKNKYFEFIVAREIVFNISRIIVLPLIILIFIQFGSVAFIISFVIAALMSLLYMVI